MQQILTYAFLVIYTVTILGIVLVIITDNADVSVFACKQAYKLILHLVSILILIDHDIAELLLIIVEHFRDCLLYTSPSPRD